MHADVTLTPIVDFRVRNFGPIAQGTLRPRDLTVLIGENNSGKSFLSTLIYASHVVSQGWLRAGARERQARYLEGAAARPPSPTVAALYEDRPRVRFEDGLVTLRERLSKNSRLPDAQMPSRVIAFLDSALDRSLAIYGERLTEELERCFGSPFKSLGRRSARRRYQLEVTISHRPVRWDLTANESGIAISSRSLNTTALIRRIRKEHDVFFSNPYVESLEPDTFGQELLALLIATAFEGFAPFEVYLPAGRSGLMRTYQAVAARLLESAARAERRPVLDGVTADLLTRIAELDPSTDLIFGDVASLIEDEVVGGVAGMSRKRSGPAELTYDFRGVRLPISLVSSMAAELAPLLLFLRHVLFSDELLIIEEPEAHLHPAAQRALARALTRLANEGSRLMITTHSDYFLSQINNMVRAAALPSDVREKHGLASSEVIDASRVAAYHLVYTAARRATTVRQMRITDRDAISERAFGEIAASLYAERQALHSAVSRYG